MRLGAIADDFTGATDLAGLLARGGARVSLRVGLPDASVLGFQGADVEVVALKIRTLPKAKRLIVFFGNIALHLTARMWVISAPSAKF
jgi:uncharacterized protein YgbK (DUF1537 family)